MIKHTTDTQPLLQPAILGDLALKNRIVMAPRTRTRARNAGKVPTPLTAVLPTIQQLPKSRQLVPRSAQIFRPLTNGIPIAFAYYGQRSALQSHMTEKGQEFSE